VTNTRCGYKSESSHQRGLRNPSSATAQLVEILCIYQMRSYKKLHQGWPVTAAAFFKAHLDEQLPYSRRQLQLSKEEYR